MRLTKITIWNFRSFWSDDPETPSADISLSPNVNYLAGSNNVGKSNLLRAVALALDPNVVYDETIDRPRGNGPKPAIELEFVVTLPASGEIKRLLEEVDKYEQRIVGFQAPSLASQGIVRYYVAADPWSREERFLTRATRERANENWRHGRGKKALERFHEVVRFVDIKSGEDLESLLQRGFKEILGSAVGDEHTKEMKQAEEARSAYVDALGQVLRPVARHVRDRIGRYVRDVHDVDLVPNVPGVADAIAAARVIIEDAVRTPLDQKGTGVRGAMLLLLLSFIAESSKSAVVFGIEEPEAFLHPDAHRELGAGLERFTQRDDVTLLVTTHSPFLFRSGTGGDRSAVFHVTKNEEGRSTVVKGKPKDVRADLFGASELSDLLEKVEKVPSHAKLLLVVEGETDKSYLDMASRYLGISLGEVHILPRGGAAGAVIEALALAARHAPGRAVAALFDSDDTGKESYRLLSDRFSWKKKAGERLYVLSYDQWLTACDVPVEAEDLFSNATMEAFLAVPGNEGYVTEKVKRKKSGVWHYGIDTPGKIAFVAWLGANGSAATFEGWRPVLAHLLTLV